MSTDLETKWKGRERGLGLGRNERDGGRCLSERYCRAGGRSAPLGFKWKDDENAKNKNIYKGDNTTTQKNDKQVIIASNYICDRRCGCLLCTCTENAPGSNNAWMPRIYGVV